MLWINKSICPSILQLNKSSKNWSFDKTIPTVYFVWLIILSRYMSSSQQGLLFDDLLHPSSSLTKVAPSIYITFQWCLFNIWSRNITSTTVQKFKIYPTIPPSIFFIFSDCCIQASFPNYKYLNQIMFYHLTNMFASWKLQWSHSI